ncbi:MAG: DNA polymerase I, partial [Aliarcobacter sp.]|nr:DNA polymerase I [Aliarcobacter sp.]
MKKTITVIDTFGFLFRSYFALPPLRSKDGFPTGLLTGFINFIANIGKDFQTDYIVFALDAKGNTFRNELFDGYKAQRPEVPEDLLKQLPIAISWIEQMGFKTAIRTGFEADDIVASIAHDAKLKGLEVRIVSHDKDLYQLIEDENDIYLFDPTKKVIINEAKCIEKYGVIPSQFTDYQSLLGDSADNIPGVKGVGAKTAEALIQQFGTLENIYANLENIEKKRWRTLLEESREMAFLSKQLVTLSKDCHVIDNLEEFILPSENPILKISDILQKYDMAKILDRINKNGMSFKTEVPKEIEKSIETKYILLNDENKLSLAINTIPRDAIVAFDTETTDIDAHKAQIVGFSFAYEESVAYYVPISHHYLGVPEQISKNAAKQAITQLNRHKLVLQNFKYDYQIIKNNFDIELNLYADTMILSWLLDTNEKVGIDYQINKYFDHKMIPFKNTVKKGENFSNVDIFEACNYAAEDALMTLKLFNKQLEVFKERQSEDLLKLAFDIEFDFIYVLANMESNGIKVDVELLKTYKEKSTKYIQELTNDIYKVGGVEFNINSPKQLGVVLFETLGLPTAKKTKTGYSTDESVLSGLKDAHAVIPLL